MWTSDELTPRSRTFIPDRGARTFNLARLSHMKRTTDTRCGSRPLTQVYTLTLSHTLSQTHYRAHTTLCHTHLISLSLSYTLSCPIQLSLSLSSTHTTTRLVTLRLFTQTYCSLTHSLTHSLNDASHSDTHRMQMRGEVISVALLHIPLYLHQLSLSLSLLHTNTHQTPFVYFTFTASRAYEKSFLSPHSKTFLLLNLLLVYPFVSHPTFLFLLLLNFFSPFSSFSSIHLKWSKWTSPTYLPT